MLLRLLVVLVVAFTSIAYAERYVAIRAAGNHHHDLSRVDAKLLFSGRTKTWEDGNAVVLVVGSQDSPAMQWVAETLFNVSAKIYLAKLKQDTFRGEMRHPLSADDDAHTISRVLSGAGIVGFVSESAAESLPDGVVPLRIRW